jgi:hypothetical protein
MKIPKDDPVMATATSLGKKTSKGERAFDLWLKNGLHRLYDDVAGEPVPEELLRMIQEDRKK